MKIVRQVKIVVRQINKVGRSIKLEDKTKLEDQQSQKIYKVRRCAKLEEQQNQKINKVRRSAK